MIWARSREIAVGGEHLGFRPGALRARGAGSCEVLGWASTSYAMDGIKGSGSSWVCLRHRPCTLSKGRSKMQAEALLFGERWSSRAGSWLRLAL